MVNNLEVPKETAKELAIFNADDSYGQDGRNYFIIKNDLVDTNRWSSIHELVIKTGGIMYRAFYSQGLTEYQDERPFQDDPDPVIFKPVTRVEKTIYVYGDMA